MICDELIDEMLSCSGGTAEKQRYKGTAGDSLASTDARRRAQSNWSQPATAGAPDRVQNYRERFASVVVGGEGWGGGASRAVWVTCSRKSINRQPY